MDDTRVAVKQTKLMRLSARSGAWSAFFAGLTVLVAAVSVFTGYAMDRAAGQRDAALAELASAQSVLEAAESALASISAGGPTLVRDADGTEFLSYDGHLYALAETSPETANQPPAADTDWGTHAKADAGWWSSVLDLAEGQGRMATLALAVLSVGAVGVYLLFRRRRASDRL